MTINICSHNLEHGYFPWHPTPKSLNLTKRFGQFTPRIPAHKTHHNRFKKIRHGTHVFVKCILAVDLALYSSSRKPRCLLPSFVRWARRSLLSYVTCVDCLRRGFSLVPFFRWTLFSCPEGWSFALFSRSGIDSLSHALFKATTRSLSLSWKI